jgi:hypothetical protein
LGANITVVDASNRPISAELVFEAISVCKYDTSTGALDLDGNHEFAFTLRTTASAGSAHVDLPLGVYQVTAIPTGSDGAVTVVSPFSLANSNCAELAPAEIQLAPQTVVTGTAIVADKRPLADATIEFLPTACAAPQAVDTDCLPRSAQTVTTVAGTYSLPLDPGGYLMRVRPAEGSGLPWVVQALQVVQPPAGTSSPTAVGQVTVPAPAAGLSTGLQLFDALGNPAAGAIVRIFENTPSNGTCTALSLMNCPYEIGEAITDAMGHFNMYLNPSAQ